MKTSRWFSFVVASVLLAAIALSGCQHTASLPEHTVERLDLDRFMGTWYVIAHIPLWPERNAWNAVEHYRRLDEDRIRTTFLFRNGGADGSIKEYRPTAFLDDDLDPATWKMQFLWPFKADFRIVRLSEDYDYTIIGRRQRDHAWIMSREPEMPETEYLAFVDYLREQGYPVEELRKVPQEWPGEPGYPERLKGE
jgi:apolipoprotein D and lipocalin family protein